MLEKCINIPLAVAYEDMEYRKICIAGYKYRMENLWTNHNLGKTIHKIITDKGNDRACLYYKKEAFLKANM